MQTEDNDVARLYKYASLSFLYHIDTMRILMECFQNEICLGIEWFQQLFWRRAICNMFKIRPHTIKFISIYYQEYVNTLETSRSCICTYVSKIA